jgi:hypothetical protein
MQRNLDLISTFYYNIKGMKKQRKRALAIVAGVVFVLLYVIFAGKPLESEFQLDPQWTINIAENGDTETPKIIPDTNRLLPFKLGQTMGYFTPEGGVYNTTVFSYKAVISPYYYAPFSQNAENTVFFSRTGELVGSIAGIGFPYFDDDRVYLFHPGGAAFSRCDNTNGLLLWTHEGYAPVFAFASSAGGSAAGCADGSIIVHSPDGRKSSKIVPGGSAYPVVLGVDISGGGNRVASISGLQKQRFVLTEIGEDSNQVLYHEYFESDSNEQGFVQFSSNDNMVYFAQPGKLTVLDCAAFKTTAMPMKGNVLSLIELPDTNLIFVLTNEKAIYRVYMLENYNMLIGSFSFEAEYAFIRVFENALYIGKDTSISKLAISRK